MQQKDYQIAPDKRNKLEDTVATIIEAILKENKVRLWDFKVNGNSFYFVLDKENGLSSSELESVHKELYRAIEASLPLDSLGSIECVTPGVVRELTEPKHFEWSDNYDIKVQLKNNESEAEKTITGLLTCKDGQYLIDGKELNLDDIQKAETIFDFKSALSKGKSEIKRAKKEKKANRAKNKQKKVEDKK